MREKKKQRWNRGRGRCLVAERDEIAEGIDRFLAQSEVSWASTVSLIDLVHMEFLHFSCTEPKKEVNRKTKQNS